MGDRVIQPSPFDEEIYGLRIGWAQGASALDHDRITTEATTDGYDLVFLRSDYPCRLHPMARLIDVRYDMTATPCGLPLPAIDGGVPLRIDEATALAASAFSHSRYLCDPQLNSRGGEVYRRWVHNAADRGELLLRPGGFLAMSHTETELRIALIAVDASCRGFGFGAAMVEESTAACHHLAREARELSKLVGQFQISAANDFNNGRLTIIDLGNNLAFQILHGFER